MVLMKAHHCDSASVLISARVISGQAFGESNML